MVVLDRLSVDDQPPKPELRAAEIHRQLGPIDGAVPVREVAIALDITDIEEIGTAAFEGALLTEAERGFGMILVNGRSNRQRRRFSIAHELGHFLCDWHEPTLGTTFECTRQDMAAPLGDALDRRQEEEANRFAIELLAPAYRFNPFLRRLPDLDHVIGIADQLDISKVAAARRYASLHMKKVAALFAHGGSLHYFDKSAEFPFIRLERGQALPPLPCQDQEQQVSEMMEVNPADWGLPPRSDAGLQVLRQQEGHAILLLVIEN